MVWLFMRLVPQHLNEALFTFVAVLCLTDPLIPTDSTGLQFHSNNQFVHSTLIVIIIIITITTHRDQRTTNEGSYTLYCILDNNGLLGYWRMMWQRLRFYK